MARVLTLLHLLPLAVYAAQLPVGPIIAAWQNWGACNLTESLKVVEEGVNVIFWFSSNLVNEDGPKITGSLPDLQCVASVRRAISAKGLACNHLLSIGGWDAPHPDTAFSGQEWFRAWDAWNKALPMPFDGFDWDLEGNDKVASPLNVFSPKLLQLVVDMSAAAKAAGYLVTMCPPQTYFQSNLSSFNRYLNNSGPKDYHPDFQYRGRNAYAYLWASLQRSSSMFDLVAVQLYETYAPAMQALHDGMPGEDYLARWTAELLSGWKISFDDPLLSLQGLVEVKVPKERLLIGLSFGSPPKSAFFSPLEAKKAYTSAAPSLRPRGYAFWNVALEASHSVNFASGLNSFLHVRPEEKRFLKQNFFYFQ